MTKRWVSVRLAVALSMAGSAILTGTVPVAAQEAVEALGDGVEVLGNEDSLIPTAAENTAQSPLPSITPLSQSDLEQPATTVEEWVAQINESLVQITEVRLNPTDTGLELVLATQEGEQPTFNTSVVGNALIIDIPNAALALPGGESFQAINPVEGVAFIEVTSLGAPGVRVAITGTDAPPAAEVLTEAAGLVLSVTPGVAGVEEADEEAIQIVVTEEQDEGYNPSRISIGTRTDTSLLDIPQSIQIVPSEVIEDQQARSVTEALRNIPGIASPQSNRSVFDTPLIRGFGGFNSGLDLFRRNGLRDPQGTGIAFETANIERIEVLRGPASVLYGQGAPGGVVNIVTEQPLSEPFSEIEGAVGNYELYRGTADLSGPLNDSRTLRYRLNLAAETTGSFIDFYDRDRFFVAPVLAWQIGENTDLTVEAEYTSIDTPNDFGLPALGTVLDNPNGDIPLDRYIGEPSIDGKETELFRFGYNLEHSFSENWQVRNAFQAGFRRSEELNISARSLQPDGRTLERRFFDAREGSDSNAYTVDTYITGNFNTGSIQHQLVAGVELYRREFITNNGISGTLNSLDLFDPSYGDPVLVQLARFDNFTTQEGLGVYVQDQVTLLDNLILVLGGRFDIVNQSLDDFIASTESFQQDEAFSPRVGIVYQPISNVSLYASYSRSFEQVTGQAFNTTLFEPQRGTQFEIGAKAELSDRLFATLALYDLTLSNVLTSDPDNPGFSVQTGEQNSQGIELFASGEILPGWNIIGGYAYTNARITEDNTFEIGNRLVSVPEHAFSLWTKYQIQQGDFQGLGFGLGLFYIGERAGDLANSFDVPDYLRTDAAIYYERDQFRAAINVRNLFNINYFEASENDLRVIPGDPLTVVGTVSWRF